MAEAFPLFGATPADAREQAVEGLLLPVAGWIYAHHGHVADVRLEIQVTGAEVAVALVARPPIALDAALRSVLGCAHPMWEPESWVRAFRGFGGGTYAVAIRGEVRPEAPRTSGWHRGWSEHARLLTVACVIDPPEPALTPEGVPEDLRALWEDLAAFDRRERLLTRLHALARALDAGVAHADALAELEAELRMVVGK